MKLLLDSQAFVRIILFPELLPPATRSAIEDGDNELYLSIASPLELQIKINIGKLTFSNPCARPLKRKSHPARLRCSRSRSPTLTSYRASRRIIKTRSTVC